jgi:hypothetical protein
VLRNGGDEALDIASHIWCKPYLVLSPETCFVLDDGTGRGVGYIVGTVDTRAFAEQWTEQFISVLEQQGIPRPGSDTNTNWNENLPGALGLLAYSPDQVLHDNFPELLGQYPSHLHIDILPNYQAKGMGRVLMQTFLEALRKLSS